MTNWWLIILLHTSFIIIYTVYNTLPYPKTSRYFTWDITRNAFATLGHNFLSKNPLIYEESNAHVHMSSLARVRSLALKDTQIHTLVADHRGSRHL